MSAFYDIGTKVRGEILILNYGTNKLISKVIDKNKVSKVSDCYELPSWDGIDNESIESLAFNAWYNYSILHNFMDDPLEYCGDINNYGINDTYHTTIIKRYLNSTYKNSIYKTTSVSRTNKAEISRVLNYTVEGTAFNAGSLEFIDKPINCSIDLDELERKVVDSEGARVGFSAPVRLGRK